MAIELVTRDEAQAFADKLEKFALGLAPKERALLQEILLRAAAAAGDDIEGHAARQISIGAAVLAASAAIGVAAERNALTGIATTHAQPAPHSTAHAEQLHGQWVEDDKGGREYIP